MGQGVRPGLRVVSGGRDAVTVAVLQLGEPLGGEVRDRLRARAPSEKAQGSGGDVGGIDVEPAVTGRRDDVGPGGTPAPTSATYSGLAGRDVTRTGQPFQMATDGGRRQIEALTELGGGHRAEAQDVREDPLASPLLRHRAGSPRLPGVAGYPLAPGLSGAVDKHNIIVA